MPAPTSSTKSAGSHGTADGPELPASRAPRWRALLRSPLSWAAVCAALGVPWFMTGAGMEFVPFLLALVCGWACGFAFVNATLRMVPARRGVLVHLTGAVFAAAFVVGLNEFGGPLLAALPEPLRGAILFMQMAAIPAAGWIWLGLLGRVTERVGRGSKRRPAAVPPAWQRDRGGATLRFTAVPLRVRTLGLAMAAAVVLGGGTAVVVMIALDDLVLRLGARLSIILLGVVVALPLYALLAAVLRRRTVECVLRLEPDRLDLIAGDERLALPLAELESIVWRPRTEVARVEVRGGGRELTLVAGVARTPKGIAAELPEPPRHVRRTLEDAGLELHRSRRGAVIAFRRPA